jgi:hypothetical protein
MPNPTPARPCPPLPSLPYTQNGYDPSAAPGSFPLTAGSWADCCWLCSAQQPCRYFTWDMVTQRCALWKPTEEPYRAGKRAGSASGELLPR